MSPRSCSTRPTSRPWMLGLLALLAVTVPACDGDDPITGGKCVFSLVGGQTVVGELLANGDEMVCIVDKTLVVETGFLCPEGFANPQSYGGFVACPADGEDLPDWLDEEAAESLFGDPRLPCAAACPAGNCGSTPCMEETDCADQSGCPPGQLCSEGTCICDTPPHQPCGLFCADLAVDPHNCGACGIACGEGQYCSDGVCHCTEPEEEICNGQCVDFGQSSNCGACGVVCPDIASCTNRACTCPEPGDALCVDAAGVASCTNLSAGATDPATGVTERCGTCDNACGADEFCVSGFCITSCPDTPPAARPLACGSDEQCIDLAGSVLEPGDVLSFNVGPGADIAANMYVEIQFRADICHGGWSSLDETTGHGLVWMSIGPPNTPRPESTIADTWAVPCDRNADPQCEPVVRTLSNWGAMGEPGTATVISSTSVPLEPGQIYLVDTLFERYQTTVEFTHGPTMLGSVVAVSDKATTTLEAGQAVVVQVGGPGAFGPHSPLDGWKFYNPSLRLKP